MMKDLYKYLYNYYRRGDLVYTLEEYIDKNYWNDKIRESFGDIPFVNLTEFHYGRSFKFLIVLTDCDIDIVYSDKYRKYLGQNTMYGIFLEISVVGPYAHYQFIEHRFQGQQEIYNTQKFAYLEEHKNSEKSLKAFIEKNGLQTFSDTELSKIVPRMNLELSGSEATLYNCLFEDYLK